MARARGSEPQPPADIAIPGRAYTQLDATDTCIPGMIAVPVALATPMTGPLVSFSAKGTNTQVQTHAA